MMKYLPLAVVVVVLAGCGLIQGSQPAAADLAARSGFVWHTDSTAHFTLFYEPGSPGERYRDAIKQDAEASLEYILKLLHLSAYQQPLSLFVVSSRQRMQQLVGRQTNATAFHSTGVLALIVSEERRLSARHELLHVVAMNRWGVPEPWINEGLAVYTDDGWHGHGLHALAQHLDSQDRLLPLEALIARFRRHDDLISYPQAGSFVKFLYEQYGLEAVRVLWVQGKAALEEATGHPLAALESEWLRVVRAADGSGIEYPPE